MTSFILNRARCVHARLSRSQAKLWRGARGPASSSKVNRRKPKVSHPLGG